jgi:hypothetical protein
MLPSFAFHPHPKVPLEKLMLSDEQRTSIECLYNSEQELSLKYYPDNLASQNEARQILAFNQLDTTSRQQLESRWNIQWSTSWASSGKTCKRTLFQWCVFALLT